MKRMFIFSLVLGCLQATMAQSIGLQQIGSFGGEIGPSNGPTLVSSIGAVAVQVLEDDKLRLDQGFYLACDRCEKEPPLSNEAALLSGVRCYPNPATDQLQLEFSSSLRVVPSIQLFDQLGRVQAITVSPQAEGRYLIELTSLAAGLYVLQAQTPEGFFQERILKR
ncbi:MAG: T9SS type A sorting domain-containing protein [Verrucomicrobiota bacterium]